MQKKFLLLQLRPEDEASDNEYWAFLQKGGLAPEEVERIRLDQTPLSPELEPSNFAGIIVGGGPGCVSDPRAQKNEVERQIEDSVLSIMDEVVTNDIPFLGCCYGIGILAHHLGGNVSKERYGEPVGAVDVTLTNEGKNDKLLKGLPENFRAFVGHKEAVQELPAGCVHLISSTPCPYQMIRHGKHVYATQFHPEADSAGFEVRIRIYKHKGYFPPEDAERLIEMCQNENVHVPEEILKNFVETYRIGV